MGVFCVDRTGATVLGTSHRLWRLITEALVVLDAPHADHARALGADPDGYVPSWLGQAWGEVLFEHLGELVLVCRPVRRGTRELRPVGLYRRGGPGPVGAGAEWARTGEHLGVYDTPAAPVLLAAAQAFTVAGGLVVTTLRPPALGSTRSEVAARALLRRSGLLPTRTGR